MGKHISFNISEETSERKIGDQPEKLDSDLSHIANAFPAVQEYRLKIQKTLQQTF